MNLTKKEYGVGLGKENKSFCYRVETELKDLGDIHGSTSYKFGLYYDKEEHKAGNDTINFAKRFGNNEDEVFDNIKNNIVNLIKAGENNDSENISKNPISPMFKGKILSLYYPDKYLCVFSEGHIDYFIEYLDIKVNELRPKLIKKQSALIEWKNSNALTSSWNNYVFMRFLYDEIKNNEADNESEKKGIFLKESKLIKSISRRKNDKKESIYDYPTEINYKREKIQKPILVYQNGKASYQRDRKNSLIAIAKANYKCEIEGCKHELFIRAGNKRTYTEPHHLVPMSVQKEFDYSLDIPENIVSLCSSCHNQIHYGEGAKELIKGLFKKRKELLLECGIDIKLVDLLAVYKHLNDDDE